MVLIFFFFYPFKNCRSGNNCSGLTILGIILYFLGVFRITNAVQASGNWGRALMQLLLACSVNASSHLSGARPVLCVHASLILINIIEVGCEWYQAKSPVVAVWPLSIEMQHLELCRSLAERADCRILHGWRFDWPLRKNRAKMERWIVSTQLLALCS